MAQGYMDLNANIFLYAELICIQHMTWMSKYIFRTCCTCRYLQLITHKFVLSNHKPEYSYNIQESIFYKLPLLNLLMVHAPLILFLLKL